MQTLPDRASDSGPDTQETPKDWHDWCCDAKELVDDAKACWWSSPLINRSIRRDAALIHIIGAIEALQEAKALLEGK